MVTFPIGTNSQMESQACGDTSPFSFNIRALALKETQINAYLDSNDFKICKKFGLFKHIFEYWDARNEKNKLLSLIKIKIFILLYLKKGYCHVSSFNTSRDIIDLNTMYLTQFSSISCQFEKWSAQRRNSIRLIESYIKDLDRIKLNCAKGQLFFSAVEIAGTVVSTILESMNVNWSLQKLFTSATFGGLSLACSLIQMSQNKNLLNKTLYILKEDKSLQRSLEISFERLWIFDRSVNKLFPHGVDKKVVHALLNEVKDLYGIQELLHGLPSSKPNKEVWLAVLFSNAVKDVKLLKDDDFLDKVDKFSKSRVAQIWWKRMQCKDFPSVPKSELEADLESCLRADSTPLHAILLMSVPFCKDRSLKTVGSVLAMFDAYYDLTSHGSTREINALKNLKRKLQKEYDDIMSLYEKLNPHYD